MRQQPQLTIECGPREERGQRLVLATLGARSHRHKFDTDSQFHRQQFRQAVIEKFSLEDSAHEFIESEIVRAADAADEAPSGGLWQPQVATMTSIQSQTPDWLWEGHIPSGAISIIDGDPGLGKSQLTLDLAARITRGDCMPPQNAPDGTFTPRGVLVMNAEDDPSRTLRPRLEAAGADLSKVHCLRSMRCDVDGEDDRPVALPGDLPAIERIIREREIGATILDPFVAHLDAKLSINNDGDVRRCLGQVAVVAESTGCAFLLVRHLNKKSGLGAIYRGGGSIGLTGAARAVFMVGIDPADSDGRILACVKSNLAIEPPSLRFSIESVGATSRIRWGETCETTVHDICQPVKGDKAAGGKLDAAKGIIADILRDGPRGSNEIEGAMDQAGISKSTYWRARRELAIAAEKSEYQGQWLLSMPAVNGFHHDTEF